MRQTNTNNRLTINHLLIVVMALLVGLQVYISNKIATTGKMLSQLEQRAILLEDDNRKLLSENVQSFSLASLSQKAKELGFVEPESVINMDLGTANLALKP